MLYLTFIGNHDVIEPDSKEFGAVISIFQAYKEEISKVYLFITPDKKSEKVSYSKIAFENKQLIEKIKPIVEVKIIPINLPNPIDYDLVYPALLNLIENLNTDTSFYESDKIINITSGTPTMTACWILLSESGIINKSKLIFP